MARDVAGAGILLAVLGQPQRMAELAAGEWDLMLAQARSGALVPHLAFQADDCGLDGRLPEKVRQHFAGARAVAADQDRTIRWEINRIARALGGLGVPVVLLKGAAYVATGLAMARGRLVSDVDIMVPRSALDRAEATLVRHGWEPMKLEPYDQRYYRTWMHELPPLRHRERLTVIDVHHTILPPSSRLKPDGEALLRAALPLERPPLHVLAPADMLLHCAAHLFHDGEIADSLRDLVDLHGLLCHFGTDETFWRALLPRARALGLMRPLYYALRYTTRLLETPVPAEVLAAARAGAPAGPARALMDRLAPRALVPDHPERPDAAKRRAAFLLYVRSHWLRMPPHLLVAHLGRKAIMRLSGRHAADDATDAAAEAR
ncbi:MAG: nucleotidyltransferase family protein [Alphaproteobacteria bacterium]